MSFASFDRRARAGESLTVVFFGASMTWGANSTDPQLYSYRANVAGRLRDAYLAARWTFRDAAIGGTSSQLGIFRLDRDVMSHKPDLVFLDFTLNDGHYETDEERLSSYEAIVRRLVSASIPVVLVVMPYKEIASLTHQEGMARREAHLQIAKSYNIAVADALVLVQDRIRQKVTTADELWSDPNDGTHPTNAGYALIGEAAWDGFQKAIDQSLQSTLPAAMLHHDTYMRTNRVRLSSIADGVSGWSIGKPNRISGCYDMLMSRWLDDEFIAARPDPSSPHPASLKVAFSGSAVLVFGEGTPKSGFYLFRIDDGPWSEPIDAGSIARRMPGNAHHVYVLAQGLDPSIPHSLELKPTLRLGEEIRLESLCIAGSANPSASVAAGSE